MSDLVDIAAGVTTTVADTVAHLTGQDAPSTPSPPLPGEEMLAGITKTVANAVASVTGQADYQGSLETSRAAGYSWPEIQNHVAAGTQAAADAGYTQEEIDQHLGFQPSDTFDLRAKGTWMDINTANPELMTQLSSPSGKAGTDLAVSPDLKRAYAGALLNGEVRGPQDFARRLTDHAGGANDETLGTIAASLPSREDLADATVSLTGQPHQATRENLMSLWQETGIPPIEAAQTSLSDPVLEDALTTPPPHLDMPGPGFIPGEVHLDPSIAPPVPDGKPRPFAPGEYVKNPNGSWSSEVTMTIKDNPDLNDGQPTVIPSLWLKDGKPYIAHSEDEAAQLVKDSGLAFPSWGDLAAADEFSKKREDEWNLPEEARGKKPLYLGRAATAASLEELMRPGRDAINPVSMLGEPVEHKSIVGDLEDLGITIAAVIGGGYVLRAGSKLVGSVVKAAAATEIGEAIGDKIYEAKQGVKAGAKWVVQGLGRLLADEQGAVEHNVGPREVSLNDRLAVAQEIDKLGKARVKKPVDPEGGVPDAITPDKPYITALEDDLNRLRTNAEADKIVLMKAVDGMPKEYLDQQFQEGVSQYVERRMLPGASTGNLDAMADAFLDAVKPLTDRQFELGKLIRSKIGNLAADDPALGIRSVEEGHVHRIVQGHENASSLVDPAQGADVITGGGGVKSLSKFAPGMQSRTMYVLENEQGERMFGSKPLDQMRNPALQPEEIGQPFKRQTAMMGDKIEANGQDWTIKPATMGEVEDNTTVRYHKNFLANTIEDVARLERVNRNIDFLQSRGEELKAAGLFVSKPVAGLPSENVSGLTRVAIPGLDGWAEPKIANVLNDFFANSKGDLVGALEKASRFLVGSLFVSPVVHAGNVGAHWAVGRGWDWIKPSGYGSLMADGLDAIREVWTLGPRYVQHLQEGSGLIYASTANDNFYKVLMHKLFNEQLSDAETWNPVARGLGLNHVVDLVKAEYKWSRKTLWAVNDMFMLQRQFELERQGLPIREAIFQAEKDIPNYRVPTEVMGSHAMSQFMQSPIAMNFGRYKFGQTRALGLIVDDMAKGTGQERVDAIGKAMVLGAMALGAYPLVNYGLRAATGDPGWQVKGFGPFSLINSAVGFAKNFTPDFLPGITVPQKNWVSALSSFISFGPLIDLADKVRTDNDVWGRPILDSKKTMLGNAIKGAEEAGKEIYPVDLLHKALTGKPQALGGLIGLDYKPPIDPKAQAKWDKRDTSAALSQERKDPIESWIRDHIGSPLPAAKSPGRPSGGGGGGRSRGGGGGGGGKRGGSFSPSNPWGR